MGTDLRTALDEYRGKRAKIAAAHDVDHHIFLVLDKDTCPFPWESMPVLRGRSVSRIPSISFLQDRIELARFMRGGQTTRGETSKSESESVRFEMDRSKTFYVLNPSGDLTRSQERFQPWLDERRQLGWRGITGRAPVMDEFSNALAANDLVM